MFGRPAKKCRREIAFRRANEKSSGLIIEAAWTKLPDGGARPAGAIIARSAWHDFFANHLSHEFEAGNVVVVVHMRLNA